MRTLKSVVLFCLLVPSAALTAKQTEKKPAPPVRKVLCTLVEYAARNMRGTKTVQVFAGPESPNDTGMAAIVNCTDETIVSVTDVSDMRLGRNRRLFEPPYWILMPEEKEPYRMLVFYNPIKYAKNITEATPKRCAYMLAFRMRSPSGEHTMLSSFNVCRSLFLMIAPVPTQDL